jgi:hypothetical protein
MKFDFSNPKWIIAASALNYVLLQKVHHEKGLFHNFGNRCIFCQKEKTDMLELFLNDGWRN